MNMSNKLLLFLLSLSILLPTTASIVRYRKLPETYHPLVYMLVLGLFTEVTIFSLFSRSSSALPTNIYYLIESLLLLWQFKSWNDVIKRRNVMMLFMLVFAVAWMIDYLIIGNIFTYRLWFQLLSSLTLILLAVNQMNYLIENDRRTLTKNPIFLICVGIILFFCYKIMAEVFFHYAPEITIKRNIFVIEAYLNVLYNILLFIAVLCITPKNVFTRQLR